MHGASKNFTSDSKALERFSSRLIQSVTHLVLWVTQGTLSVADAVTIPFNDVNDIPLEIPIPKRLLITPYVDKTTCVKWD